MDPAGEVINFGNAFASEQLAGHGAAHAVVAQTDDRPVTGQLVQAPGQIAQGDPNRAVDTAVRPFAGFAHIEYQELGVLDQPGL